MSSVIKNPPLLVDLDKYEQWKEDVEMWTEVTDLKPDKQALAIHLTLTGQAREVANQVSKEDKKKEDGVKVLLAKLDETFLQEPERRKFTAYQNFEECVRGTNISVCDFMREFDMKYHKMKEKGMTLPDEVLAFRLVKNCKLSDVQREQVMASTKPLTFKEVRATLKRMFESSSGGCSEGAEGLSVKVKTEPVYLTKSCDELVVRKEELEREIKEINLRLDSATNVTKEESDVLWTNQFGGDYSRWTSGRRNRYGGYGYGRSRRYFRRNRGDNGCFLFSVQITIG